jgi:hypothetical protein
MTQARHVCVISFRVIGLSSADSSLVSFNESYFVQEVFRAGARYGLPPASYV